MDKAEEWLKKNDPEYLKDKRIKLRKQQEKRDYYANMRSASQRSKLKKFPKG